MRPSPRRLLSLLAGLAAALVLAALSGVVPALAQTGPPGTPTLQSPANGAVDVSPTLTLSWTQPTGAIPGTTVYKVFLSDWQTEQNLPTLTTTSTSLAVPASEALQYGHRYFWSVQACNGTNCSATSGEWDFFVQGPPGAPGHATLVSATASTTPTFTWNQPAGATAGSTVYIVGLQDDATGDFLPNLPPTTNLYTTAPSSENLQLGHTYDWAVNACNGNLCSGFTDQWTFTTATAPGSPLQASPANGATVTLPTAQNPTSLVLSWNQPAGAIPGTTQYYVSLYDPYGEPQGHFLGDLPLTTNLSTTVPPSEGLVPGQQYFWNVQACNGTGACSGYSSTWWSFVSGLPALATASGAGSEWVVNPDFGGSPPTTWTNPPLGWVGIPNTQQAPGTWGLQSAYATSLAFPSTCSGGGSCANFRVGYILPNSLSGFVVFWIPTSTQQAVAVYYDPGNLGTPLNTWFEATFSVPSSLGTSGWFDFTLTNGALVAYLDQTDAQSARGVPRVGVTSEPRFPKAISAAAGAGVDTVTGALNLTATDLSVPGVAGTLSFTRAYSTRSLILPGQAQALGARWTHNWQTGLAFVGPSADAVVLAPGGGSYTFHGNGGSSWSPSPGVNASFVQSGTSAFTLTTADQHQYHFTLISVGSSQRYAVTSLTDRNGNAIGLTYDASGNVTQVKDVVSGRYLSLYYSGGRLLSVNDNLGRIVYYGYTGNDLTGVGTMLGGSIGYSYDGSGYHWLTGATDPQGTTILTNTYDSKGRVATQQDGGDGTTRGTVTYHYETPSAGVTQVVDQRGKTWSYYYNARLVTTDLVSPTNIISHWDYDADNNVVDTVNNLNGETVTGAFSYDASGNPLTATDALGYTTTTTYNGQNEPLTVTDPLHHVTTNTYDSKGNLHTTQNPGGFTTTYAVDPTTGQVTSVTDPLNHTTSYGYTNSYHDRTTVTDALGHTTTTAYDAAGRVTQVIDPLNHSISYTYSINHGEVDTVTVDPGGINAVTTTTLNTLGQKVSVQDPNGHTTSYSYDPRGLLHVVTDALNHQTSYTYDASGNQLTVTDANGKTTSYTYNDAGQVLTVVDPNGVRQHLYAYDAIGRVSTHTDARGISTTVTYDLRGAVTQTTFSNGDHALGYSYDADGNRLNMTDASGTTSYAYDALNRPTSVTDGNGNVVQYVYDAAGHRTQILYPVSARPVTYAYDAANRLTSVTDWNQQAITYGYDNANRLTGVTFPASTGVSGTLSYDTANRLTGTSYSKGGSTIAAASYTLDPAGNRTSKTLSGSYLPTGAAGTEYYCLDALNRLSSVRTAAGCTGGTQTQGYAYDNVGNRTSMTTSAGTTSYAYDNADQLTSVTPPGSGATTYAYDAAGNQLNKGTAASFSWNALNQLTSATQNSVTTTNVFNGDGFRMSRTDSDDGSTSLYTWDTAGTGQVLDDSASQFLYGALGLYAHVKSSQTYYYLTDGLGSVLAEVKSDGTNAVSYQYDVYGNIVNQRGSLYDERQFAGEQADPTGLTYLRARFYDATTGRFLSRDPKDGWSYGYAGDNPAANTDPSGLDWINWYPTGQQCPCYPIGAYNPDTGEYVSYGNDGTAACDICTGDATANTVASQILASPGPSYANSAPQTISNPVKFYRAVDQAEWDDVVDCGCFRGDARGLTNGKYFAYKLADAQAQCAAKEGCVAILSFLIDWQTMVNLTSYRFMDAGRYDSFYVPNENLPALNDAIEGPIHDETHHLDIYRPCTRNASTSPSPCPQSPPCIICPVPDVDIIRP